MRICKNCGLVTLGNWTGPDCPHCGAPLPRATPDPAPRYEAPAPQAPSARPEEMGVGGYLGYLLLFMIPVIGFVLTVVFGFIAHDNDPAVRNLARAYLIRSLLTGLLWIVFLIVLVTVGVSLFGRMAGPYYW